MKKAVTDKLKATTITSYFSKSLSSSEKTNHLKSPIPSQCMDSSNTSEKSSSDSRSKNGHVKPQVKKKFPQVKTSTSSIEHGSPPCNGLLISPNTHKKEHKTATSPCNHGQSKTYSTQCPVASPGSHKADLQKHKYDCKSTSPDTNYPKHMEELRRSPANSVSSKASTACGVVASMSPTCESNGPSIPIKPSYLSINLSRTPLNGCRKKPSSPKSGQHSSVVSSPNSPHDPRGHSSPYRPLLSENDELEPHLPKSPLLKCSSHQSPPRRENPAKFSLQDPRSPTKSYKFSKSESPQQKILMNSPVSQSHKSLQSPSPSTFAVNFRKTPKSPTAGSPSLNPQSPTHETTFKRPLSNLNSPTQSSWLDKSSSKNPLKLGLKSPNGLLESPLTKPQHLSSPQALSSKGQTPTLHSKSGILHKYPALPVSSPTKSGKLHKSPNASSPPPTKSEKLHKSPNGPPTKSEKLHKSSNGSSPPVSSPTKSRKLHKSPSANSLRQSSFTKSGKLHKSPSASSPQQSSSPTKPFKYPNANSSQQSPIYKIPLNRPPPDSHPPNESSKLPSSSIPSQTSPLLDLKSTTKSPVSKPYSTPLIKPHIDSKSTLIKSTKQSPNSPSPKIPNRKFSLDSKTSPVSKFNKPPTSVAPLSKVCSKFLESSPQIPVKRSSLHLERPSTPTKKRCSSTNSPLCRASLSENNFSASESVRKEMLIKAESGESGEDRFYLSEPPKGRIKKEKLDHESSDAQHRQSFPGSSSSVDDSVVILDGVSGKANTHPTKKKSLKRKLRKMVIHREPQPNSQPHEVIILDSPIKTITVRKTKSSHLSPQKPCHIDLTDLPGIIDLTQSDNSNSDDCERSTSKSKGGTKNVKGLYISPPLTLSSHQDPDRTPELPTPKRISKFLNSNTTPIKCVSSFSRKKMLFNFPVKDEHSRKTPPLDSEFIAPNLAVVTENGVTPDIANGSILVDNFSLDLNSESDRDLFSAEDAEESANEVPAPSSGDSGTQEGERIDSAVFLSDLVRIGDKKRDELEILRDVGVESEEVKMDIKEEMTLESVVARGSVGGEAKEVMGGAVGVTTKSEVEVFVEKEVAINDVINPTESCALQANVVKQNSNKSELIQPNWKGTPLLEVKIVMAERSLSDTKTISFEEVKLLSSVQDSIIDNWLEQNTLLPSLRLYSLVEHLRRVTTLNRMPRVDVLKGLWKLLLEPQEPGSLPLETEAVGHCILYLRELLAIHPLGKHKVVNQQYTLFIESLGVQGTGTFGLWEHIDHLLKSSSTRMMASFVIDILVADFWAVLATKKCGPPLFLRVFWSNSAVGNHMTMPIRNLIHVHISDLMQSLTKTKHLQDLGALLFLAGTVCTDMTTELMQACKKFPKSALLEFLPYVYSTSLHDKLINSLPVLKQTFDYFKSVFNPEKGIFFKNVQPVPLTATPLTEQIEVRRKRLARERNYREFTSSVLQNHSSTLNGNGTTCRSKSVDFTSCLPTRSGTDSKDLSSRTQKDLSDPPTKRRKTSPTSPRDKVVRPRAVSADNITKNRKNSFSTLSCLMEIDSSFPKKDKLNQHKVKAPIATTRDTIASESHCQKIPGHLSKWNGKGFSPEASPSKSYTSKPPSPSMSKSLPPSKPLKSPLPSPKILTKPKSEVTGHNKFLFTTASASTAVQHSHSSPEVKRSKVSRTPNEN